MSGLSYRITCVEIDPDLVEDFGLDPEGDHMLYTVDDEEMDTAAFTDWLRETANLSPGEIDWESGGGMNISGQEYAYLDVPDNPSRPDPEIETRPGRGTPTVSRRGGSGA